MNRLRVCAAAALAVLMPQLLTAEDNKPPRGFKALFNGKDLKGWQGLVELPQRAKLFNVRRGCL